MAKKDYIEKITQNLKHLTKDELKDVSVLTTAQYGVRLKVAEKEYIEKEIANLTPQLQQQALPVVPECVAEWYESHTEDLEFAIYVFCGEFYRDSSRSTRELTDFEKWFDDDENSPIETLIRMKNGYQVEKPQLFYIEFPNVYGLKNKIFVSKVKNGTIVEFSNKKNYALKFTEQEIKAIDERYWQFAVPVEDGE